MNNRNNLPVDDFDWREFVISLGLLVVIIFMAVACHAQVSMGVGI